MLVLQKLTIQVLMSIVKYVVTTFARSGCFSVPLSGDKITLSASMSLYPDLESFLNSPSRYYERASCFMYEVVGMQK